MALSQEFTAICVTPKLLLSDLIGVATVAITEACNATIGAVVIMTLFPPLLLVLLPLTKLGTVTVVICRSLMDAIIEGSWSGSRG